MAINKRSRMSILIFLAIALIAISFYFYKKNTSNKKKNSVSTFNLKIGLTNQCRGSPKFISGVNMRSPALDSRQQDGSMGFMIRDSSVKDTTWQHESWNKMKGYIGTFDITEPWI